MNVAPEVSKSHFSQGDIPPFHKDASYLAAPKSTTLHSDQALSDAVVISKNGINSVQMTRGAFGLLCKNAFIARKMVSLDKCVVLFDKKRQINVKKVSDKKSGTQILNSFRSTSVKSTRIIVLKKVH